MKQKSLSIKRLKDFAIEYTDMMTVKIAREELRKLLKFISYIAEKKDQD